MPPLKDDARWRPIAAVHRQLIARNNVSYVSAADLEKALARGRVHCVRRSAAGDRKRVARKEWGTELVLRESRAEGLGVHDRLEPRKGAAQQVSLLIRGWHFFVWQPDIDTVWPASNDSSKARNEVPTDFPPSPAAPAVVVKTAKQWLDAAWGHWPKRKDEKVKGYYDERIRKHMQLEFNDDKVDRVLNTETIRVRYYEHQRASRVMPPVK